MAYKILPEISGTVPSTGPTENQINGLIGPAATRMFYSQYDKDTHFEYKVIYSNIDEETLDNEKTNAEKKKAWYNTILYHWNFCQVLPCITVSGSNVSIFSFYGNGGFSSTKLTTKEDTIENIKRYNLSNDPTWQELYNSYAVTQTNTYNNATKINTDAYNQAAFVKIQSPSGISEAEFKKLIDRVNSVFKFNLPNFPGNYYYDKTTNKWEIYE